MNREQFINEALSMGFLLHLGKNGHLTARTRLKFSGLRITYITSHDPHFMVRFNKSDQIWIPAKRFNMKSYVDNLTAIDNAKEQRIKRQRTNAVKPDHQSFKRIRPF